MRRLCAVVFTALLLMISGCWSRRELTDVSFAGAMGIDWVDAQYLVSLNILSPRRSSGKESGSPQQNAWTFSERAPSIDAAISKLDQILERSLTLSHVRTILIGEATARRGIGPIMDFLLRSVEIRPAAWVGITNGAASDLINARPRQEPVPTDGPLGHHDIAQKRSSITPAHRITQVANILQEEGIDLALPLFRRGSQDAPDLEQAMDEGAMHGSAQNREEIIYGGAGVFVDDRLVGWLTPAEVRGILWGTNKAVHGGVSAECPRPKPSQRIVFRLRRNHGRVSLRIDGGKLQGLISVKVVADVNENSCEEPALFDGDTSQLEASLEGRVRDNIQKAVAVAHETGSDFFGFGQSLFRLRPAEYTARQANWHEIIKKLAVQVEVKAQVVRTGQSYRRYQWHELQGKP